MLCVAVRWMYLPTFSEGPFGTLLDTHSLSLQTFVFFLSSSYAKSRCSVFSAFSCVRHIFVTLIFFYVVSRQQLCGERQQRVRTTCCERWVPHRLWKISQRVVERWTSTSGLFVVGSASNRMEDILMLFFGNGYKDSWKVRDVH